MSLKKQNKLTKLRKINTVDPERNKAVAMNMCGCSCSTNEHIFNNVREVLM